MARNLKLHQEAQIATISCVALDGDYLRHTTFGDAALQQEILGLFAAQLDGFATALKSPLTAERWRYLCHTLKGASAALGALEFASLANDWERQKLPTSAGERQVVMTAFAAARVTFQNAANQL